MLNIATFNSLYPRESTLSMVAFLASFTSTASRTSVPRHTQLRTYVKSWYFQRMRHPAKYDTADTAKLHISVIKQWEELQWLPLVPTI